MLCRHSLRFKLENTHERDEDHHGPLAIKMLDHLIGQDQTKWEETRSAAINALQIRKVLWDGIHSAILEKVES